MLIRLIVLFFALNTLSPSVMAITCEMMSDHDMSSMSHGEMNHDMSSMSHDMMNHDMSDKDDIDNMTSEHVCNSTCCVTSCVSSLPLLSFESIKSFDNETISIYPNDNLLSLYEVFIPISTPPPLV